MTLFGPSTSASEVTVGIHFPTVQLHASAGPTRRALHTFTEASYWLLPRYTFGVPPRTGLIQPDVLYHTVVCDLPNGGRTLARARNGDPHRVVQLLFKGVNRDSFVAAVRAEADQLLSSASGRGRLIRWWRSFPSPPLLSGLPDPGDPPDPTLVAHYFVQLADTQATPVPLRHNTIFARIEDGLDYIRIAALSAAGPLIVPVAVLQDILEREGVISYTPIRDAPALHPLDVSAETDISLFPTAGDGFARHLLPVFDAESTCRPNHKQRRKSFRGTIGASPYVIGLEYTNPTGALHASFIGADAACENRRPEMPRRPSGTPCGGVYVVTPGLNCTDPARVGGNPNGAPEFGPRSTDTCIVGCVEYVGPEVPTFENWSASRVTHYTLRKNRYDYTTIRSPGMVTSVVIHDTTSNTTPTNIHAHFLVERGGRVSQMADLLERVSHADSHSETSVGIEVQNDWNFIHDEDLEEADDPTRFAENSALEHSRGSEHRPGIMRIPPSECLESLWQLVSWLTDTGKHPLKIPRIFPQLDPRLWSDAAIASLRGSAFFPSTPGGREAATIPFIRYLWAWAGLSLSGARSETLTTKYWHVTLKDDTEEMIHPAFPGVYAHCAISQDKGDGVFTTLYLWLRSIGLEHDAARNAARAIIARTITQVGARWFVDLPDAALINDAGTAVPLPPNSWVQMATHRHTD